MDTDLARKVVQIRDGQHRVASGAVDLLRMSNDLPAGFRQYVEASRLLRELDRKIPARVA